MLALAAEGAIQKLAVVMPAAGVIAHREPSIVIILQMRSRGEKPEDALFL
jgi:hypothetical protein